MSRLEVFKEKKESTESLSFKWVFVPGCKSKIVAFREERKILRDGKLLKHDVNEIVAFEECFKKYMQSSNDKHLHKDIEFKGESEGGSHHYWLQLVSKEFLKRCAEEGYGYTTQDEKFIDKESVIARKPFTSLRRGREYVPVMDRGGWDHSLRYVDNPDRHYPNAIHFDYIDACMENKSYDLERVIKILSKRTRVRTYNEDGKFVSFKDMNAEELGELIRLVPYYNNDSGTEKYLSFWWQPTQKEMDKFVTAKQSSDHYNKHKVIFELDLLGLRKGGASKYEKFWGKYDR